MSRGHRKSKLEKAQEKAWRFYQAWRKTGSLCPAFNNERIYVSRLGWNHLVSPRKKRTAKEKIRLGAFCSHGRSEDKGDSFFEE